MITPMSRVVVAATSASKEETLKALRDWGLLHILPLQNPDNEQVATAKAALTNAQRALEALPAKAEGMAENIKDSELLPVISGVLQKKKAAEEVFASNTAELDRLEAFGNIDPNAIKDLSKHNVYVKLYSAEEKKYDKARKEFVSKEFKRADGKAFFAVFSENPVDLPYSEIALPSKSTEELKKDKALAAKTIAECEKKLAAYASKRKNVGELILEASDELALKAADAGMHSEIGISFINGYCPKDKLDSLHTLAARNGWGITEEEPAANEAVPTLLKHPKAIKPIDALYSVIGISPGYREIDISSVFLCFFSVFFAMIVGDAVYGLLFLGITIWASNKFPAAPRHVFHFLYLMSGCTIVWGLLNGNYLGLNVNPGESMAIPAFLDLVRAPYSPDSLKDFASWVRNPENVKLLCFILGVVHLSIARIWNAAVHLNEKPAFVVQIGWLFVTWMMFFLTCNLVLNRAMPEQAFYVGGFGVALIMVGNILRKEWFGVGMIALDLVSSLTNIISYIRLFAVGMAGYAIANTFSNMVGPLFNSIPGAVVAVIILCLVHTLNLALCAMGVAVHAIRLNTLEFSNNVGVEWSGDPYIPFRKMFNHSTTRG